MNVELPLGSPDCRQVQNCETYLGFTLLECAYDTNVIKY